MYKYILINLDDSTFKYLKTKQDVIKIAEFMWQNDENYQNGLYKGQLIDKDGGTIETEIEKLMADDEVTSKKGIYKYILDGQEKHLSLRAFDKNTAKTMYTKQQGHCPYCDQKVAGHTYPQNQTSKLYGANTYEFDQMQADHIKPWSKGGKTVSDNCQMLCKWHNEHKSDE